MNEKNIKNQVEILLNQFNAKNFDEVINKSLQLIKQNPEFVILYNLLGSSYQNKGDFKNAEISFKNGLKLDGNNIALMNNLATSYKNLLEYKKAEDLFYKILELNNKYINAYINLGNLKRDLNNFHEAIELYNKALSLNNKNPVIFFSLALGYQGLGEFQKANENAKKTLEIDPNFTQADHLISQSTKYKKENEHYLNLLKKINKSDLHDYQLVDICFSLAKAEEDIGNIKKACDYLIKGNKLKKKLMNYNVAEEINLFDDIKRLFKNLNFQNFQTKNSDNIIFILGMPRSGTSLVEQIITSHSDVFGAGELPILSNIIKNNFLFNKKIEEKKANEIFDNSSQIDQIRTTYINFIKNFKYKEKFITDKAPLNFRWIGFIKLLFPNAKVIHCTRDPKNNCLSMYKNLFEGGLNFTYDQTDLVKYYKSYQDLMDFWKELLGNFVYEVKYENLIKNESSEIKQLIKFCSIGWEENCLKFHKNKSPIKTMSTAQARNPIYKSSLNSFDKYREYLNIIDKSW